MPIKFSDENIETDNLNKDYKNISNKSSIKKIYLDTLPKLNKNDDYNYDDYDDEDIDLDYQEYAKFYTDMIVEAEKKNAEELSTNYLKYTTDPTSIIMKDKECLIVNLQPHYFKDDTEQKIAYQHINLPSISSDSKKEKGGWVEGTANVHPSAIILPTSEVKGTCNIGENVLLIHNVIIKDNCNICGDVDIDGPAIIEGESTIDGGEDGGGIIIKGNSYIKNSTLTVQGVYEDLNMVDNVILSCKHFTKF